MLDILPKFCNAYFYFLSKQTKTKKYHLALVIMCYLFLVLGEINRFLHIHWNLEYISKVDNNLAYKCVLFSKLIIVLIVIFVANCDPRILKCDTIQSYVCNQKKIATHVIIPIGLSLAVTISVCLYFVRKVYFLSKTHPLPISVI